MKQQFIFFQDRKIRRGRPSTALAGKIELLHGAVAAFRGIWLIAAGLDQARTG
jgi:hypothetical protein